jgi:hypothetical protein
MTSRTPRQVRTIRGFSIISQTWSYGGIEFAVGQPEIVGFPDPFEGASWNAYNPDTEMMYGFVGFEDEGPPPA